MTEADPRLLLLPEDIRSYIVSLPSLEEQSAALDRLVQARELTYRTLNEQDVDAIKARTDENSAFGFLAVDVSFTWSELSRPGYIAIGAFDERDEAEVPVAFVIAELSRIEEAKEWTWEARKGGGQSQESVPSSTEQEPSTAEGDDVQDLLVKGGWRASDVIARVYYVGVDFEFRKQGVGRQLLDIVKEVAKAAGAPILCLEVAEWNGSAIEFYLKYGLQKTDQYRKGERGNHILMVEELGVRGKSKKGVGAIGQKVSRGGGRKGGSSSGKKGGFGIKAMLVEARERGALTPRSVHCLARSVAPIIRRGADQTGGMQRPGVRLGPS
jgi:ribosomal protein S18 acetylase RimI-like enzyme